MKIQRKLSFLRLPDLRPTALYSSDWVGLGAGCGSVQRIAHKIHRKHHDRLRLESYDMPLKGNSTDHIRQMGALPVRDRGCALSKKMTGEPLVCLPNESQIFEAKRDGYSISTERSRLDIDLVHRFLSEDSYWARGLPKEKLLRALSGSLPFGLYSADGCQIGFGRVITDFSLFCYLRDVFILAPHRGTGLGTWLCTVILDHPDLAEVPSWMLATIDAHDLYAKIGFRPLKEHSILMQLQKN